MRRTQVRQELIGQRRRGKRELGRIWKVCQYMREVWQFERGVGGKKKKWSGIKKRSRKVGRRAVLDEYEVAFTYPSFKHTHSI